MSRWTHGTLTELTKMKRRARGRRARTVNVVEITIGGRFSGVLNMCCMYTEH